PFQGAKSKPAAGKISLRAEFSHTGRMCMVWGTVLYVFALPKMVLPRFAGTRYNVGKQFRGMPSYVTKHSSSQKYTTVEKPAEQPGGESHDRSLLCGRRRSDWQRRKTISGAAELQSGCF